MKKAEEDGHIRMMKAEEDGQTPMATIGDIQSATSRSSAVAAAVVYTETNN